MIFYGEIEKYVPELSANFYTRQIKKIYSARFCVGIFTFIFEFLFYFIFVSSVLLLKLFAGS